VGELGVFIRRAQVHDRQGSSQCFFFLTTSIRFPTGSWLPFGSNFFEFLYKVRTTPVVGVSTTPALGVFRELFTPIPGVPARYEGPREEGLRERVSEAGPLKVERSNLSPSEAGTPYPRGPRVGAPGVDPYGVGANKC